jgi:hypothetical protein
MSVEGRAARVMLFCRAVTRTCAARAARAYAAAAKSRCPSRRQPCERYLMLCSDLTGAPLGPPPRLRGGRGPIRGAQAGAPPLRRLLRKAHACFPTRGGPWPRAPPRARAPRSLGTKQGRGPHPHFGVGTEVSRFLANVDVLCLETLGKCRDMT